MLEFVNVFGCRFPGLVDATNAQYQAYRVPNPIAPYPQDYIIDQQGRVAYWAAEYDPQEIMRVIDRLLAEPPEPQLEVTLAPISPPIVIPANGGSFNFNASVQRTVAPQAPFTVWARIKNPDGTYTPPTLGPVTINPPVGVTVTRQRTQNMPGSWPPGLYSYVGYANTTFSYPAIDSSSFTFTKSAVADGGPEITNWYCYGEPFPGEVMAWTPPTFNLAGAYPNPFNPTTAINFTLPEVTRVTLNVYDMSGRQITTLVNGMREAGAQQVTFDGTNLASGIYIYTLVAGQNHAVGKMVLMK